ncbi:MAG: hypothetical protein IKV59_01575 [Lachnospiraceae bacterium]|nr:hypothetical protein [Lachnospiraceae bacterium]
MLKRKMWTVAAIGLLMCGMTGCGVKEKTEEEIRTELQAHSNFGMGKDVTIEEFEVIKRQTDKDDKTDKVFVEVTAGNEEVEFTTSYGMVYGLYDSGWILDEVYESTLVETTVTPKQGPSDTGAIAVSAGIEDDFSEYSFAAEELDLANGNALYVYQGIRNQKYMQEIVNLLVNCRFDETALEWKTSGYEEGGIEAVWDIAGTWKPNVVKGLIGSDWYEDYEFEISDVEGADAHIRVYNNQDGTVYLDTDFTLDPQNGADVEVGQVSEWMMDTLKICIRKDNVTGQPMGTHTRGGCQYLR